MQHIDLQGSLVVVADWIAHAPRYPIGRTGREETWTFHLDEGGDIFLTSCHPDEPHFAITRTSLGEYEVFVCDPNDEDVLGPFCTLGLALRGVGAWLNLPTSL